jgi:hypothetical protein
MFAAAAGTGRAGPPRLAPSDGLRSTCPAPGQLGSWQSARRRTPCSGRSSWPEGRNRLAQPGRHAVAAQLSWRRPVRRAAAIRCSIPLIVADRARVPPQARNACGAVSKRAGIARRYGFLNAEDPAGGRRGARGTRQRARWVHAAAVAEPGAAALHVPRMPSRSGSSGPPLRVARMGLLAPAGRRAAEVPG